MLDIDYWIKRYRPLHPQDISIRLYGYCKKCGSDQVEPFNTRTREIFKCHYCYYIFNKENKEIQPTKFYLQVAHTKNPKVIEVSLFSIVTREKENTEWLAYNLFFSEVLENNKFLDNSLTKIEEYFKICITSVYELELIKLVNRYNLNVVYEDDRGHNDLILYYTFKINF